MKLAKGDAFCSPEHFDAHQLQLSKSAFDRLISSPAEDGPRAPLVMKSVDVDPPPPISKVHRDRTEEDGPRRPIRAIQPEDSAPDIRTMFRPQDTREEILPMALLSATQAPPYAPFAIGLRPVFQAQAAEPVFCKPDQGEPIAARPELAWPVRGIEEPAGALSLFLLLNPGPPEPVDFRGPVQTWIITPENFAPDTIRPGLGLTPAFADPPELQAEPEPVLEVPPLAIAILPGAVLPEAAAPPPECVAAAEALALINVAPSLEAISGADVVPAAATAPLVIVLPPRAAVPPAASAMVVEPMALVRTAPTVRPSSLLDPIEAPPAADLEPPPEPRLPFLLAPSFRERPASPETAIAETSATPNGWKLQPVLSDGTGNSDSRHRLPDGVPDGVPAFLCFIESPPVGLRNTSIPVCRSASELPVEPLVRLPGAHLSANNRWHAASSLMELSGKALEAIRAPARPVKFLSPSPATLLIRPEASFASLNPAAILGRNPPVFRSATPLTCCLTDSSNQPLPQPPERTPPIALAACASRKKVMSSGPLLENAVGTTLARQNVVFVNPPASATSFAFGSILAAFPADEGFAAGTWRNDAAHFPLTVNTAAGQALPPFPQKALPYEPGCIRQAPARMTSRALSMWPHGSISWSQSTSLVPPREAPTAAEARPDLRLSAAHPVSKSHEISGSGAFPVAVPRPFIAAGNVVFALAASGSVPPANLPFPESGTHRVLKVGLCEASAVWEPLLPDFATWSTVKLLPIRQNPVLPETASWKRLRSLAQ